MASVDRLSRPAVSDLTAVSRGPLDRASDGLERGARVRANEPSRASGSSDAPRALMNEAARRDAANSPPRDTLRRYEPQAVWKSPPAADDLRTRMAAENKQTSEKATEMAARRAVREYGEA